MEWIACVATISCHFPVRDIEQVSEQAGEHVLGKQKNRDKGRVWGKKFSPPSPPSRSPPPPPFQFFAYPRHAPSLTCFLTHLFNLSTWKRKGHGYYERLWNWKCMLLYWVYMSRLGKRPYPSGIVLFCQSQVMRLIGVVLLTLYIQIVQWWKESFKGLK